MCICVSSYKVPNSYCLFDYPLPSKFILYFISNKTLNTCSVLNTISKIVNTIKYGRNLIEVRAVKNIQGTIIKSDTRFQSSS